MMKTNPDNQKNSGHIGRRKFVRSCFACSACLAAIPAAMPASMSVTSARGPGAGGKLKIRIIYSLHEVVQPRPDWPNVGYDFAPVMEQFTGSLKRKYPQFEFVPTMAAGPEETEKIVATDRDQGIDGYIVFQMNCWNRIIHTVVETGKPVLYADYTYAGSGGFLVYTAGFLRAGTPNLGFVSSSDLNDLLESAGSFEVIRKGGTVDQFVEATRQTRLKATPEAGRADCLSDDLDLLSPEECYRRMKQSRILAVRDENSGPAESVMGIPMEYVSFAVVNEAWKRADRDRAAEIARRWQDRAEEVLEVPFETLQNSAAMYLGMKEVLQRHDANAIAINCLGGFYGGHIHAYPCLGFHELNNEGLVGACECDIRSAATMVAFSHMTQGRPGYISDPVIDTSKREIIYAHCVASNRVFGPDGPSNPFSIMTHSEDRQGASVRSFMPLDYLTTTLEIHPGRKEILMHRAISRGNDTDDRACRTKLCAEPVGDMEKLFTMWDQWGWHRVTFYGDLRDPAYALADEIGWELVEEA